jgi:biotin carboxyl carrier protein
MKLIVKVENQSFEVEVGDIHARPISATVDGEVFEVWPEDVQLVRSAVAVGQVGDLPAAAQPAFSAAAPAVSPPGAPTSSARSVLAPLPGVVVEVSVRPGDVVAYGQELCTIEAMKMKNVIRASRAGMIEAVRVTLNQHVKHHDVLLDFTDWAHQDNPYGFVTSLHRAHQRPGQLHVWQRDHDRSGLRVNLSGDCERIRTGIAAPNRRRLCYCKHSHDGYDGP